MNALDGSHNGKVIYVCARRVEVFIDKLKYAVRITPYTLVNGTRLSKQGNDLSDHFKYGDVISCKVEPFCRKNGWRSVDSVQKIDDSGSGHYFIDYGHVVSLTEQKMGWAGRVQTRNGGTFYFEDRIVAVPFEKLKRPLNRLVPAGFTVKVKYTKSGKSPKEKINLVSLVPMTDFDEIDECFGVFVNIDNSGAVLQDNERKFGDIYMKRAAFRSCGDDCAQAFRFYDCKIETGKEQLHFQVIKNLPGERHDFAAISVHLTTDCQFTHSNDVWLKPLVSKMKSNASVATKQQNQSHHESQTDILNFQELKLNIANPLGLPSRTLAVLKSNVVDEDNDFVGEFSSTPRSSARCSPSPKRDFLEFGSNDTSSDNSMELRLPNQVANTEVQTSRTNVFEQEIERFLNLFQENVINDTETYEFLQSKCQSFLLSGMRISHLKSSFK